MRTTLNIDDNLYRAVKIKAATEHRTVTELVEVALRSLIDQTKPLGNHGASTWSAPPFPTIDTKRLAHAPTRTLSLSELTDLTKEAGLESDAERYDATFGH